MSSEMVTAVLPLYLSAQLGLSALAIGAVESVSQLISALLRFGGGRLADRTNRQKEVAFVGYAASSLARLVTAIAVLASVITPALVLGLQIVDRLGKGIRTAPRDSLISLTTPREHLGYAFGIHRTFDAFGALAGPLLAMLLLVYSNDNYSVVFVWSVLFAVIGLFMIGLLVRNPVGVERESVEHEGVEQVDHADLAGVDRADRADLRNARPEFGRRRWSALVMRSPWLKNLLRAGMCLGLVSVGDAFVFLALRERNQIAARWFPLLFAGTAISYLALAVPVGRVADRFGRVPVMAVGYMSLATCYVVVAVATSGLVSACCALTLLGLYYAATDGVFAGIVSACSRASDRTTTLALAATSIALGKFVSALTFGLLVSLSSYQTGFVVFAGFCVLATVVALRPLRRLEEIHHERIDEIDNRQLEGAQ